MLPNGAFIRVSHVRELSSPVVGDLIDLTDMRFTIGRAATASLCLDDGRISRVHTEIVFDTERFWISDAGSVNGTYVNGRRLVSGTRQLLKDGDEIAISPLLVLRFFDSNATIEEGMPPQVRGGLALDETRMDVFVGLRRLEPPLPRLAYRLLRALVLANGTVVELDTLIEIVWQGEAASGVTPATLDNQISRLRQRLAQLDPDHDYIERVRNKGLRFSQRPD